MNIRAIRGATKLSQDNPVEIESAVSELLLEMLSRNGVHTDKIISVYFTATPDIVSAFPAAAARKIGWGDIPLICSVEMAVTNSLPLVVRVMMHVNSKLSRDAVNHVYLRGAEVLRMDIAQ